MKMKDSITTIEIHLEDINESDLFSYIQKNYAPEEVFSSEDLKLWAEENGFSVRCL